jgi:hypothetical protein
MDLVLGRGNLIEWKLNNKIINIYDHSYNSDFSSLLNMFHQSQTIEGNNIIIFTPLRECADVQDKYYQLSCLINKNFQYLFYNPHHEPINFFHQFNTKDNLTDYIISQLNQLSETINIFIKGANSFGMIDIVINLLEFLGNSMEKDYYINNDKF